MSASNQEAYFLSHHTQIHKEEHRSPKSDSRRSWFLPFRGYKNCSIEVTSRIGPTDVTGEVQLQLDLEQGLDWLFKLLHIVPNNTD